MRQFLLTIDSGQTHSLIDVGEFEKKAYDLLLQTVQGDAVLSVEELPKSSFMRRGPVASQITIKFRDK